MVEGLSPNLTWTAACVFALSLAVAVRHVSAIVAVLVVAVRVGIPVLYFAWHDDGTWRCLDDLFYLRQGSELYASGLKPWTPLIDDQAWLDLHIYASGHHILYVWWNSCACWLFGPHYYAPVLLNVFLSFLTGHFLCKLLEDMEFPAVYGQWFFLFFVLHWDTVAWSSFLNVKDPMVQLLTVVLLGSIVRFFQRLRPMAVVEAIAVSIVFYWLRFYIPVLVAAATGTWMLSQWRDPRKWLLLSVLGVGVVLFAPIDQDLDDVLRFESVIYQSVRFSLTPQPWAIVESYGFLFLASVLHLLFYLPSLLGAISVWQRSPIARLLLMYFLAIVVLYAASESDGVRHRSQASFVIALAQFEFLWRLWKLPVTETVGRRPTRRGSELPWTAST